MNRPDSACPACGETLISSGADLICPACSSAYRALPHCPGCGGLLETLKACGAVDYFCPACNELQSKRAVAFRLQAV